jgi:catechol 2,3-dioxygenase-like lactoylglutathione lyase family enzyme
MSGTATMALSVADLTDSLVFYVERLGLEVLDHDERADVAIIAHGGYTILLAGPRAGDIALYLSAVHGHVQPGATLFLAGGDLDSLHATLRRRGVHDAVEVERPWGDRSLTLRDPDGYAVEFWTPIQRPPDEVLALYEAGPAALDAALAGLDDAALDWAQGPGAWTIRQIVHHLADAEATALGKPKFALAEPGRVYQGNPYDQGRWAEALDYAHRPIAPSLELFRAIRAHMTQLMRHLPDAWERATENADGQPMTAGLAISMLTSHALGHMEDIRRLREHLPLRHERYSTE